MNKKNKILWILTMVLFVILWLAGMIIFVGSLQEQEQPQNTTEIPSEELRFSNLTIEISPEERRLRNLTIETTDIPLGIMCSPYHGEKIDYQVAWIIPQCAIIDANPEMYDKSLKDYHVCFKFKNKSVGDCK